MTDDDILKTAVECGIIPWTKHEYIGGNKLTATDDGLDGDAAALIQFAHLVIAHEREQCAKVCEEQYEYYGHDHIFAKAIRARGNT